jgi:hypothetical protein
MRYTRAVWKFRGLTLLLWAGTLYRCGDGLFFEVPPLASDARLTTLLTSRKRAGDRWSLRNFLPRSSLFMVGKAQKSHGERSGGCYNGVPPIHFFQTEHRIQFRSRPMRFLGFSNHENGAPRQEISKRSTVCSTFSRSGWSVVRSISFVREVLRKRDRHRTSTKFRLGVIRWVHELCKRPSYSGYFNKFL